MADPTSLSSFGRIPENIRSMTAATVHDWFANQIISLLYPYQRRIWVLLVFNRNSFSILQQKERKKKWNRHNSFRWLSSIEQMWNVQRRYVLARFSIDSRFLYGDRRLAFPIGKVQSSSQQQSKSVFTIMNYIRNGGPRERRRLTRWLWPCHSFTVVLRLRADSASILRSEDINFTRDNSHNTDQSNYTNW